MRLHFIIPLTAGLLCGAALLNARVTGQPSIDPPAGPITESQRFGVGTAINATNTPGDTDALFKITSPGSYYLADHITITDLTTVSGKPFAIEIAADDVTIDLNGFTIARRLLSNPIGRQEGDAERGAAAPPAGSAAITTSDSGSNGLRVSNGNIRGFEYGVRTTAFNFGGLSGSDSALSNLDIDSPGPNGRGIVVSNGWTITNCYVRAGRDGIVTDALSLGGATADTRITGCTVVAGQIGVSSDYALIEGCVVTGGAAGIDSSDSVIRGCVVVSDGTGIFASRSTLDSCRVRTRSDFVGNPAIDLFDGVITNCYASAPPTTPAYDLRGFTVISNSSSTGNSNVSPEVLVVDSRL